ncbi:MAG: hypothetical protein HY781_02155 [Chloroflexi bacterium]|nr:hypothetical protein [Chloroflexota bacterium]
MKRSPWFRKLTTFGFALTLIVLGLLPALPAAADDEFPQENAWSRATPSIVWCDDPESTTTLEVHIVGRNDVARVWITGLVWSDDEGRVELYDDGTHGDPAAGDDVFTLGGVVLPCNPDFVEGQGGYDRWMGMLRVELDNGTQTGNNYGISAGVVHTDYKGVFSVQDFGSGLSATAYAFFIQDSSYEVMDGYPIASVTCGKSNFMAYRKLYSVLPDAFDFAMVMPGLQIFRPADLAENVPYDVLVSNSVEHIGMDIMDNTAEFGSAGRLKSAIYHSFGELSIFDHEVAHTWGAAIGQSLGLINEDWDVNQGHWSEMTDIEGQLGAYYFDPSGAIGHFAYNGDDTWRLIPNYEVEPYSPLELYIMGLIPPEEVPPVHILNAPNTTDQSSIAASYQTVTIDQIIQAEGGPRSPTYAESQKDFTLAFIVTQDLPYNDAAYAYFSLLARSLETTDPPDGCCSAPFFWATGGRATLTSLLPLDMPDPLAQPELPAPSETPFTQVETEESPVIISPTEESEAASPFCFSSALMGLLVVPVLWVVLRKKSA